MRKSANIILMILFILLIFPVHQANADNPIITILDFTTEGVSENEMKTVISLLSSSLFQMGSFTVIDVGQRENILKEIEFSAGGCSDDSCMLEIGMLLSAEMIVTGSLSRIGSRYILSSKLLDTETGKTLGTADGIYNDLDMMVDDLFDIGSRLTKHLLADSEKDEIIEIAEETEAAEPRQPIEIDWKTVGGISLASAGAIAAGLGGYFLYDAVGPQTEAVDAAWFDYDTAAADFDSLHAAYLTLYDTRRSAFIWGISAIGVGILSAAGGTVLLIMPDKEPEARVTAALVPSSQSLGFNLSIRY